MALNGTREGLFNAVVALGQTGSKILIPNPFYQVYTVAAMADRRAVGVSCPRAQKVDFCQIWMR